MRLLSILMVVSVLAAGLLFAGCEGKSAETSGVPDAQSEGTAPEDSPAPGPQAPATTGKALDELLASQTDYVGEYRLTAEGETTTMTMAYDLPRFATLATYEGAETHMIYDGSTFTMCSKVDGEWMCLVQNAQEPENLKTEEAVKEGKATMVYQGSCTAAGLVGSSYEVTSEGVTSKVCYTNDGILLRSESPGSTMEATKITKGVQAALFTAPAEAQDLSAMMPAGMQVPGN